MYIFLEVGMRDDFLARDAAIKRWNEERAKKLAEIKKAQEAAEAGSSE